MSDFELIVPPKFQTAITGFVIGAQKIMRGKLWRVEFYTNESVRLFCNDVPNNGPATALPRYALDFIASIRDNYVEPMRAQLFEAKQPC